jgi:NADH dehydrogenase
VRNKRETGESTVSKGIVIAGGGFAGLWAALVARREINERTPVPITVVSRDEYLTIRPRLYEAKPEALRVLLADTLSPVGIELVVAEIEDVDPARQYLSTSAGDLGYERLVLATGSRLRTLPVPGAERCLDIDTYAGALQLDSRLSQLTARNNRIVIIGAGFTGIELATELRPRIAITNPELAAVVEIVLVDQATEVGSELGCNPRPIIEQALADARVELCLGTNVAGIDSEGVDLADGRRLDAAAVVNCAGLESAPCAPSIRAHRDKSGRLHVDEMLRVEGFPTIFAAGDAARAQVDDAGHTALMSCQHALYMGRYAGYNAAHDLLGLPLRPYRQERYVTCLDLGSTGAVFTQGWDRQVAMIGDEANAMKREINTRLIYPPTDAAEILRQATLQ